MQHFIAGKVIIVTGGTSGFGFETARELLAMDAKVVITGRDEERLAQAAQALGTRNLLAVRADVTITEHWQHLVEVMPFVGRNDRYTQVNITALHWL